MTETANKHIWTKEELKTLKEFYPHFGSYYVATILGLPRSVVKAKVDKLKLQLLPKEQRICLKCKSNFQVKRSYGYYCKECFSIRRQQLRRDRSESKRLHTPSDYLSERFRELTRSARYRGGDVTADYLLELYTKQKGKCYYSGIDMMMYPWGNGSNHPYGISIDRKDSDKGYTQDNIVLCCYIVNIGKNTLNIDEYIDVCKRVVSYQQLNEQ